MKHPLPPKYAVTSPTHVYLSRLIDALPDDFKYKGRELFKRYLQSCRLKSYDLPYDSALYDAINKLVKHDIEIAITIVIASCN